MRRAIVCGQRVGDGAGLLRTRPVVVGSANSFLHLRPFSTSWKDKLPKEWQTLLTRLQKKIGSKSRFDDFVSIEKRRKFQHLSAKIFNAPTVLVPLAWGTSLVYYDWWAAGISLLCGAYARYFFLEHGMDKFAQKIRLHPKAAQYWKELFPASHFESVDLSRRRSLPKSPFELHANLVFEEAIEMLDSKTKLQKDLKAEFGKKEYDKKVKQTIKRPESFVSCETRTLYNLHVVFTYHGYKVTAQSINFKETAGGFDPRGNIHSLFVWRPGVSTTDHPSYTYDQSASGKTHITKDAKWEEWHFPEKAL